MGRVGAFLLLLLTFGSELFERALYCGWEWLRSLSHCGQISVITSVAVIRPMDHPSELKGMGVTVSHPPAPFRNLFYPLFLLAQRYFGSLHKAQSLGRRAGSRARSWQGAEGAGGSYLLPAGGFGPTALAGWAGRSPCAGLCSEQRLNSGIVARNEEQGGLFSGL